MEKKNKIPQTNNKILEGILEENFVGFNFKIWFELGITHTVNNNIGIIGSRVISNS